MKEFDKFHKNKYYRVKEKIDISGKRCYIVQSATCKLDVLFGLWKEYTKENATLEDAIIQIESINTNRLLSEKTVHAERRN